MDSKVSILRDIQRHKEGGFIQSNKNEDSVAIVKKGRLHRFINKTDKSDITEMQIDNMNYIIEPYIPRNHRSIIFLSGDSGSGKTLMTSIFINQYIKHNPKNKVFYICATKKEEDDNLYKIKALKQMETNNIDEIPVEDMSNNLVVIDDTDFHPDHKKIMKFMNKMVECGRKFNISIIYSSHIHSKLSESPIYKEVSMYCTFPNALINNRMITNNLKIDDDIIKELLIGNNAYICFNKIYRTIITDKIIMRY